MTTAVQFSWRRLEGLGLIIVALGWGFLAQFPPAFFALTLLYFDLETYFIAFFGTLIGTSIILATISCSLTEDWDDSTIPTLKSITTFSMILTLIFLGGFFLFFILEPFFPPEFTNLVPSQRYFSAITLSLAIIGITTFFIYKTKKFFIG
ncbi:MAG: hypothetical protein ACFFB2_11595 [Promethearchaeota archaeon]